MAVSSATEEPLSVLCHSELVCEPADVAAASTDENFRYGAPRSSAFSWALGGRVGAQFVQLASTLILGRIVAPSQFGIYAAAGVLVALGQIFTDLGLGPAVVYQSQLSERFLATAFWINALTGVALSLASVLVAWPLSEWYGYDSLIWVVPVASLAFTFSLSTISLALLERSFRFRFIAIAELVAICAGQATSVLVAQFATRSALALALGPVISAAVLSAIVLTWGPWRPNVPPVFDRSDARKIVGYSSYLSVFNLITFGARNSDDFLLGHFISPRSLGFYSRSYQLMLLPVALVTQALSRAFQPMFARVKHNRDELQQLYTRAYNGAALIGFPAAVVLFSLAPSGIPVLLGNQWSPMVPVFQIFALSVPTQVLGAVNGVLYTATGNVRLLLMSGAVTSGALVAAFAVSAPHGPKVVAVVFVIHSFVTLPIAVVPILRRLRLSFKLIAARLLAVITMSGGGLLILSLVPSSIGFSVPSVQRLIIQLVILVGFGVVGLAPLLLRARGRKVSGLSWSPGKHRQ